MTPGGAQTRRFVAPPFLLLAIATPLLVAQAAAQTSSGDWRGDAPGVQHRIAIDQLPAPYASASVGRPPTAVAMPAGAALRVPPGFTVQRFVTGLTNPRIVRVAPNGDIFVAETSAGRLRVLRAAAGAATAERIEVFATGLDGPFGMAFHPAGNDPQWLYVANNNSVVRFPYRNGDLKARSAAEVIVRQLSPESRGHSTRDLAFSADGRTLYVSVGSGSNVAEGLPRMNTAQLRAHENRYGLGAAWGDEALRASVLAFDPQGAPAPKVFAAGLRNCVGMLVHPRTGDLWCSVNERDGLGDDLVPDYLTRVPQGSFFGWPWYYLGNNEDPRQRGKRPDLRGRIAVPDVLLQAHSAPLGATAYVAGNGVAAFPASYDGDLFVALHGSWNRLLRTGYKVVRVPLRNGVPAGYYEDFLTGFVLDSFRVWGRPVGVAVARDGALLVSDDGGGSLWRISYARAATEPPK